MLNLIDLMFLFWQYIGTWEKGIFKEGQWIMTDGNYYEGSSHA